MTGYYTMESPKKTVRRKNWFGLAPDTNDLNDSEPFVFTEIRKKPYSCSKKWLKLTVMTNNESGESKGFREAEMWKLGHQNWEVFGQTAEKWEDPGR